MSDLEQSELDDFVMRSGLSARTDATLSTRDSLLDALEAVRMDGFAIDDEENESRIRCLAAPVRDVPGAVIGGVSVSTVTFLVSRDELLGWEKVVRDAASVVSKQLA
jgi:DNA-binding IclR family transcriptional regulator